MVELNRVPTATGEWECMECGHIEEGTLARRPLKCPECNAPAEALEFFSYDDDEEEEWESGEDDDALDDEDDEYEEDIEDDYDDDER